MKYTKEIVINKSRDIVSDLFDSQENIKEWQEGLVSFDAMSGEAGTSGAKSRLKYDMNGRKLEMIETITEINFPEKFSATYESKGVWNEVHNTFVDDNGKTKWIVETEFRFSSFPMKVMGFLMPGLFKKQTMQFMEAFKKYAESK